MSDPSAREEVRLDLDRLKALAEKATPGEWRAFRGVIVPESEPVETRYAVAYTGEEWRHERGLKPFPEAGHNCEYIAAANPSAILSLIAELERLRAEREWRPTHRHYKGGLYRERTIRDSEDWHAPPAVSVAGWTIYENEGGELIKRRTVEFVGVLPDGRRRFEPLDEPPSPPSSEHPNQGELPCA